MGKCYPAKMDWTMAGGTCGFPSVAVGIKSGHAQAHHKNTRDVLIQLAIYLAFRSQSSGSLKQATQWPAGSHFPTLMPGRASCCHSRRAHQTKSVN